MLQRCLHRLLLLLGLDRVLADLLQEFEGGPGRGRLGETLATHLVDGFFLGHTVV